MLWRTTGFLTLIGGGWRLASKRPLSTPIPMQVNENYFTNADFTNMVSNITRFPITRFLLMWFPLMWFLLMWFPLTLFPQMWFPLTWFPIKRFPITRFFNFTCSLCQRRPGHWTVFHRQRCLSRRRRFVFLQSFQYWCRFHSLARRNDR